MRKYIIPICVDLNIVAQQLQKYELKTSLEKIHDRLIYLVGIIYRQSIYKMKDDVSLDDLWVPLQSELLKKVLGFHYLKYKKALYYYKVIDCIDSYIAGMKSMEYCIHERLSTGACKYVKITDSCVLQQIKKVEAEIQKQRSTNIKGVKHLTQVLDTGKLTINEELVNSWIIKEDIQYRFNYELHQDRLDKGKEKEKIILHPDLRIARHKQLLDDFISKKYNYSVDGFGNRFHSILTYSPAAFRNFLKYDGEQLVSLDLKNSQPYLLNGILFDDFMTRNGKFSLKGLHPDMYHHLQKMKKEKKINLDILVIPVPYRDKVVDALGSKQMRPLSIMLQSIAQSLTIKGVQDLNFSSLCQKGLYEFLTKEFNGKFFDKDGDTFDTRDKAKLEVMHMFYCNPKNWKSRKDMKPFEEFLKLFPAEGNLLLLLKTGTFNDKEAYKNAPMLLQRMESYLFLDIIAKKLTKMKIPVLTIHDSITVRERDKAMARQIMENVLLEYIGITPTIKEEYWR